jgi:hypothetical protein
MEHQEEHDFLDELGVPKPPIGDLEPFPAQVNFRGFPTIRPLD